MPQLPTSGWRGSELTLVTPRRRPEPSRESRRDGRTIRQLPPFQLGPGLRRSGVGLFDAGLFFDLPSLPLAERVSGGPRLLALARSVLFLRDDGACRRSRRGSSYRTPSATGKPSPKGISIEHVGDARDWPDRERSPPPPSIRRPIDIDDLEASSVSTSSARPLAPPSRTASVRPARAIAGWRPRIGLVGEGREDVVIIDDAILVDLNERRAPMGGARPSAHRRSFLWTSIPRATNRRARCRARRRTGSRE